MSKDLAAKMRDNINKKLGREVVRNLTTPEELLQVEDWIEMPEYFTAACGGKGWPCGHVTQIVGDSDTGKTTLLMEAMLRVQDSAGIVFLIDSEHKFSFSRFSSMGGRPEEINTISVESLEEAWNALNTVCDIVESERTKNPDVKILLAWDSVAASVPDAIIEAEAEDHHVSVEAKINNKEVRKIRQRIRHNKICAIFINHTYRDMPKYGAPKEILKGGSEMFFMSTLIVKTRRKSWLEREVKGMKQKYGTQSMLEVFKGHLGGRKTTTEFFIIETGIVNEKQLEDYKEAIKGKL